MRRSLSLWLLAVLLAGLSGCSAADPEEESEETSEETTLRSLADGIGFTIGTAVDTGIITSDAQYAAVLAREFNAATPANALKFGPLRPTEATYSFGAADAIIDYAEAHEMTSRGHTLVWHQQLPIWLENGSWSRDELMNILHEHISTVVGRYKGRISAWDVVNEAVADDGSLRNSIWLDVIGPEYISLAFEWAHEADPDARLFYNDYNAEGMGSKSNAVYELVQDLLDDGVPIHGVGLQMHVSTEFAPSAADVAANIERLGNLGMEVHITEMDVRIPLPASAPELAQQADLYQTMLEVCLEAWNCTSFVVWGFTDRYSWIPSTFDGYGEALIFDANYNEKFAYEAIRNALNTAD